MIRRAVHIGLCLLAAIVWLRPAFAVNDIDKQNFNFGHQLGYLYSRMDDAYFHDRGWWSFETGIQAYYTARMPRVTNPDWQRRTFLQIPGQLQVAPGELIILQLNSDLVGEFPRQPSHSIGGNSPRFGTKIRLLQESDRRPALALTLGVKFSSAKPENIYENRHSYAESNGLAGLGTGVADYFIVFTASRSLRDRISIHGRLGLAPLGNPTTQLEKGPGQADEILYGLKTDFGLHPDWVLSTSVTGMFGVLSTTSLDHYSVARLQLARAFDNHFLTLNLERGLTPYSDDWVGGLWYKVHVQPRRKNDTSAAHPAGDIHFPQAVTGSLPAVESP